MRAGHVANAGKETADRPRLLPMKSTVTQNVGNIPSVRAPKCAPRRVGSTQP